MPCAFCFVWWGVMGNIVCSRDNMEIISMLRRASLYIYIVPIIRISRKSELNCAVLKMNIFWRIRNF